MIKTNKEVLKFLIKIVNLFCLLLSILIAIIWHTNLQDNMYLMGDYNAIIVLFFVYFFMSFIITILISSTAYLNYFQIIRNSSPYRFLSFFLASTIGSFCILNYNKYSIVSIVIIILSNLSYIFFYLKFNYFLDEKNIIII